MLNSIKDQWIKLKENINNKDYIIINQLQNICKKIDKSELKLELDYKLALVNETTDINNINEFMYFIGDELIGYIGIFSFSGKTTTLEVNGMVHPEHRRKGIFSTLYKLLISEAERRNTKEIMFLSDRESLSGQKFIKKTGAEYKHSEYEMYLDYEFVSKNKFLKEIEIRKATNSDSHEISRQNTIYFSEESHNPIKKDSIDIDLTFIPEEEEKRGVIAYIAINNNEVIGKVHLQIYEGVGGIFGLGVLPEYRGKGYGRTILILAVNMLKEKGAKKIMLQVESKNFNALNLYKSCGFYETSVMEYYIK